MYKDKPMKTFVMLPVYLKDEYRCAVPSELGQIQVNVGDEFVIDKRPGSYAELRKMKVHKVAAVKFNVFDNSRLIELEPVKFMTQEQLDEFMKGKRRL